MDEIAKSAKSLTDELRKQEGITVSVIKNGNPKSATEATALINTETKSPFRSYFSFESKNITQLDSIYNPDTELYYNITEVEEQVINDEFIQLKVFTDEGSKSLNSSLTPLYHPLIEDLYEKHKNSLKTLSYEMSQLLKSKTDNIEALEKKLPKDWPDSEKQGFLLLIESCSQLFNAPMSPAAFEVDDHNEVFWLGIYSQVLFKLDSLS